MSPVARFPRALVRSRCTWPSLETSCACPLAHRSVVDPPPFPPPSSDADVGTTRVIGAAQSGHANALGVGDAVEDDDEEDDDDDFVAAVPRTTR